MYILKIFYINLDIIIKKYFIENLKENFKEYIPLKIVLKVVRWYSCYHVCTLQWSQRFTNLCNGFNSSYNNWFFLLLASIGLHIVVCAMVVGIVHTQLWSCLVFSSYTPYHYGLWYIQFENITYLLQNQGYQWNSWVNFLMAYDNDIHELNLRPIRD